jgi:hypothetical protein
LEKLKEKMALRQLVWNQKMCNFMDGKFYDLSIT